MDNLDYTTADLESPLADVKLDIQHVPFDKDTFDVVICNHVLEHVPDDRQAMREIYRILKPGGFAILQVPMDPGLDKTYEDPSILAPRDREKHFRQKDHYRLYGRDYPERLKEAGFQFTGNNYIYEIENETIERYRLPSEEYMMACHKRVR
jgi:SAM-dependent methyltransferase